MSGYFALPTEKETGRCSEIRQNFDLPHQAESLGGFRYV